MATSEFDFKIWDFPGRLDNLNSKVSEGDGTSRDWERVTFEIGKLALDIYVREEGVGPDLADALILAGMNLKRIYVEREQAEFDQLLEEEEREKKIFEEQGQLMSSGEVNVA